MGFDASEMVSIPRGELDALRAEAAARIKADPGPGDAALMLSHSQLAEAWGISD